MADERREGPESTPAGHRAAQERDRSGADSSGRSEEPARGVLTLVCFKCGTEYYFTESDPPEGISCEKCGNSVFREFFSPVSGDEAAQDFEDSTARDLDPDDAEGDTMPGDVLDLNRD